MTALPNGSDVELVCLASFRPHSRPYPVLLNELNARRFQAVRIAAKLVKHGGVTAENAGGGHDVEVARRWFVGHYAAEIYTYASQGTLVMRLPAVVLLGFVITSAAEAQTSQVPDPPKGQTLLNGLMGKSQPAPSGKVISGETQEQHDHYIKKDPYTQPITSSSVRSHTDD